ncbi:MAG: hypothetical protein KDI19_13195, partial [Pseudomonadales bacterium]|nr:hypothetical protein [Pseudomonadales bacterium]
MKLRVLIMAIGVSLSAGAGARQDVASFVWKDARTPEQDGAHGASQAAGQDVTPVKEERMDAPVPAYARYLWDEDSETGSAEGPAVARFMWDPEVNPGLEGAPYRNHMEKTDTDVSISEGQFLEGNDKDVASQVARYLWDEAPSTNTSSNGVMMARYLWDEESGTDTSSSNGVMMARYLWDEAPDKNSSSNGMMARYLWDEESGADNSSSNGVMMARYLWDEAPDTNTSSNGVMM